MRRILVISPREPCGTTWLLNCLLELGIRTWRVSPHSMWIDRKGESVLHPREDQLKKWMPALSAHGTFRFRDDVEVEWAHAWRTRDHDRHPVLYFTRDPRDAIYSRYRRESPGVTFEEFATSPDPDTLLDRLDSWREFNRSWRAHPHLTVARFEDYRQDARGTLSAILAACGIDTNPTDIARAVDASTFERAKASEDAYHATRGTSQKINNSGVMGAFRTLPDTDLDVMRTLEQRAGDVMAAFGYACELRTDRVPAGDVRRLLSLVPFFDGRPTAIEAPADPGDEALHRTLRWVTALDIELLRRGGYSPGEIGRLLGNLTIFCRRLADATQRRSAALVAGDVEGSAAFGLQLVREAPHRLRWLAHANPRHLVLRSVNKLKIMADR